MKKNEGYLSLFRAEKTGLPALRKRPCLMDLRNLPIGELRQLWAEMWGKTPHSRMGRTMLEKSIIYKQREQQGLGLTPAQKSRLNQLVQKYKDDPTFFDTPSNQLKPGIRLVKMHEGKKHSVLVKSDHYEYNGLIYFSLSSIANNITGTKVDGKEFFGIKISGC